MNKSVHLQFAAQFEVMKKHSVLYMVENLLMFEGKLDMDNVLHFGSKLRVRTSTRTG